MTFDLASSLMLGLDLEAVDVSFFTTSWVVATNGVAEVETGEAIVKTDIRFPFVTQRVEQRVIGAALESTVFFLIPKYLGFMQTGDLPKLAFFFKGFPEDVRFRRHTVPEALEIAKGTMYEAWYRAVKLSPYMAQAIDTNNWRSQLQQDTYLRFGDLRGTTFESWWLERGYELFMEKGDFKKIGVREGSDKEVKDKTLILEIPLTVSPATLKQQFDELLREHHEHYKRFDRWQHSSATGRLQSSKLTSLSINLYLDVYEQWQTMIAIDVDVHLFAVGEAMALNPRLTVKHGDLGSDVREKHLKMSLMVSEYLEKAKNLIAHASEGVFPCTDDHDWIDRSKRASNWRQRTD